jgi:hypothetical protein
MNNIIILKIGFSKIAFNVGGNLGPNKDAYNTNIVTRNVEIYTLSNNLGWDVSIYI